MKMKQWLTGRVALKQAYIDLRIVNIFHRDVEIDTFSSGVPFIKRQPELQVSIAHSQTNVIAGIGNVPLGVDIEYIKKRDSLLCHYVGKPEEFELISDRDSIEQLYILWVLKEALLKAMGVGLSQPMLSIQLIRRSENTWLLSTKLGEIRLWQGILIPVSENVLAACVFPAYVSDIPSINWFQPSELCLASEGYTYQQA